MHVREEFREQGKIVNVRVDQAEERAVFVRLSDGLLCEGAASYR